MSSPARVSAEGKRTASVPTGDRTNQRSPRTRDTDAQRRVPEPRTRSAAAERAYARRRRMVGGRHPGASYRAPFVVLVMGLLGLGLVTTLWLSTTSSADSIKLERIQAQNDKAAQRVEQLRHQVASESSAPVLSARAGQLGMVPAGDPARLVVLPDGSVIVIGTPKPAPAPPPPPVQPGGAPPGVGQGGGAPPAPVVGAGAPGGG